MTMEGDQTAAETPQNSVRTMLRYLGFQMESWFVRICDISVDLARKSWCSKKWVWLTTTRQHFIHSFFLDGSGTHKNDYKFGQCIVRVLRSLTFFSYKSQKGNMDGQVHRILQRLNKDCTKSVAIMLLLFWRLVRYSDLLLAYLDWILGRLVLFSEGKNSQFILEGCHCRCRDNIFLGACSIHPGINLQLLCWVEIPS